MCSLKIKIFFLLLWLHMTIEDTEKICDVNVSFYIDTIKCRETLNQLIENYFRSKVPF